MNDACAIRMDRAEPRGLRFEEDTAMGKYKAYQRMRQLATQKKDLTPETFLEELARQANLTAVGQAWWTKVETRLTQSEDMQVAMMQPWALTFQVISSVVEQVKSKELKDEQYQKSAGSTSKVVKRSHALVQEQEDSTSGQGDRGRESSTQYSRGRSSSWGSGTGDRSRSTSRDTRDSRRENEIKCMACGCWHFETPGYGKWTIPIGNTAVLEIAIFWLKHVASNVRGLR